MGNNISLCSPRSPTRECTAGTVVLDIHFVVQHSCWTRMPISWCSTAVVNVTASVLACRRNRSPAAAAAQPGQRPGSSAAAGGGQDGRQDRGRCAICGRPARAVGGHGWPGRSRHPVRPVNVAAARPPAPAQNRTNAHTHACRHATTAHEFGNSSIRRCGTGRSGSCLPDRNAVQHAHENSLRTRPQLNTQCFTIMQQQPIVLEGTRRLLQDTAFQSNTS